MCTTLKNLHALLLTNESTDNGRKSVYLLDQRMRHVLSMKHKSKQARDCFGQCGELQSLSRRTKREKLKHK